MSEKKSGRGQVWIGRARVFGAARDLLNARNADIRIDDIEVHDLGGDVVHVEGDGDAEPAQEPSPKLPKRKLPRGMLHGLVAIASVAGGVAVSGISHALGWS